MEQNKNLGGRPPKEIDFKLLDNLLGIFCTGEECAAVMQVSYDTIERKVKEKYGIGFADYVKRKNNVGRASLRRRQYEMSKTNPALAIWMGKQFLGQKDNAALIDQSQVTNIMIKVKDINDCKELPEGKRLNNRLLPASEPVDSTQGQE